MIKKILENCGILNVRKKNDFSSFFYDASCQERKKVIKSVARSANNEQRALMDRVQRKKNTSSQN
jgi:hypothetical protein